MPEAGDKGAVGHLEGHAGQKHPVKHTLEDGGKTKVPHRIDKHQRLRPQQPLDIACHIGAIDAGVVIVNPLLPRQDRIEAFGIEIAVIHFMALRPQHGDGSGVERRDKARLDRVSVENQNAHQECLARPGKRNVLPVA